MSRIEKITVTFEVYERDMPSERRAQYRQAIIDAMAQYGEDTANAIDELGVERVDGEKLVNAKLIDKMLEDCNR